MRDLRRYGLALALALAGCSTEMQHQPSLRAEDAPRPPPDGSVALGSPDPVADRDEADDSLTDPVAKTPDSIARGAFLFHERCACCHGEKGNGDGPVSKVFPQAPDLHYAVIVQRSDGYLWGTITFGGRVMPPQAEGLSPSDRWDLVNYVRSLQGGAP